jgi:hypothetical protein
MISISVHGEATHSNAIVRKGDMRFWIMFCCPSRACSAFVRVCSSSSSAPDK